MTELLLPSQYSDREWEYLWSPYDPKLYNAILEQTHPEDIVVEIGAGDLRLAIPMAEIAKKVYAIELNKDLLFNPARLRNRKLPVNLVVICGDARKIPFPEGVTLGVLLMRHCRHFALYVRKLLDLECPRLITNARWRMGFETISLLGYREPFSTLVTGWFACLCGATGFVSGPVEAINSQIFTSVREVAFCPSCRPD